MANNQQDEEQLIESKPSPDPIFVFLFIAQSPSFQ